MALNQNLTFQARLEKGQLYVSEHSPDLPSPEPQTHLQGYLRQLLMTHFQVKQMAFEGFDLTVELEPIEDESKALPQYLVQVLEQTLASYEMSAATLAARLKKRQQEFQDDFSENARKRGWSELAVSKPLVDISGCLYIISIWIKA